MTYLEETEASGRVIFPDLARAWALFGIALVNVGMFAYPMNLGGYAAGGLSSGVDVAATYSVNALFLMKSYTLFAFMFGVGFAFQLASADRAGVSFAGRYWRRILGLFFFAAINIILFFQGDILFIYGLLGSLLFFFRKLSARALVRWAMGLYLAQVLLLILFAGFTAMGHAYAPESMAKDAALMAADGKAALAIYSEGSFLQTVQARTHEWTEAIVFMLLFQGIGAMSFFLFGLAAVRNDLISKPAADFWQRARWRYLPIGLIISGFGAWVILGSTSMMSNESMTGMALIALGAPFSTAGYLGLIAKWSLSTPGPIKTFFARGGTASLTAYLMQNMLLSIIFYGFGFGFYAELGAAQCILIAAIVALFTIGFTSVWRVAFKRGPLEYLLRGWTYLKFG